MLLNRSVSKSDLTKCSSNAPRCSKNALLGSSCCSTHCKQNALKYYSNTHQVVPCGAYWTLTTSSDVPASIWPWFSGRLIGYWVCQGTSTQVFSFRCGYCYSFLICGLTSHIGILGLMAESSWLVHPPWDDWWSLHLLSCLCIFLIYVHTVQDMAKNLLYACLHAWFCVDCYICNNSN